MFLKVCCLNVYSTRNIDGATEDFSSQQIRGCVENSICLLNDCPQFSFQSVPEAFPSLKKTLETS